MFGFSDIDASHEILLGHDFGGVATFVKKNVCLEIMSVAKICKGCASIKLKFTPGYTALLVNLYLPYDTGANVCQNASLLANIADFVSRELVNIGICVGDLNADLSRNTEHVALVKECFSNLECSLVLDTLPNQVPYTFINTVGNSSCVDHFVVDNYFVYNFSAYFANDNGIFMSDHIPLSCTINMPTCQKQTVIKPNTSVVCWDKASNEDLISYKDYQECFAENALPRFNIMHITNVTASDTLHNVFIELQDRCVSTACECIKMKSIYGWIELVKPFQTKCINAHQQWQLNDRPKFSELATSKRVTRLQYHYAIHCLASIKK